MLQFQIQYVIRGATTQLTGAALEAHELFKTIDDEFAPRNRDKMRIFYNLVRKAIITNVWTGTVKEPFYAPLPPDPNYIDCAKCKAYVYSYYTCEGCGRHFCEGCGKPQLASFREDGRQKIQLFPTHGCYAKMKRHKYPA